MSYAIKYQIYAKLALKKHFEKLTFFPSHTKKYLINFQHERHLDFQSDKKYVFWA